MTGASPAYHSVRQGSRPRSGYVHAMTDTDAPPLASSNYVTNVCTEGPGFAVDEEVPGSEFVDPPEGE